MRRLLRIVAVLVLLVLVAGGIAVWSLLSDRERLTQLLVDTLRKELALDLTLGAPAEVTFFPQVGVRLSGITVGAASAATTRPPLATARELTVAVPWSTLFGGDLEIASLTIDSPEIHGAELSGWIAAYSGAEAGPPAPPRWPRITAPVLITNGRYFGDGTTLHIVSLKLSPLIAGKPMWLRFGGAVNDGNIYFSHARFLPVETPSGIGLDDFESELGSTTLRGHARYSGQLAWSAELDVTGVLPAGVLPAQLGLDPGARTAGRIRIERNASHYVIGIHGDFASRKVAADFAIKEHDPESPLPAVLDTFARTARGTATIDRLDISGVQLEGIRIEAEPIPPDDEP